MAASPIPPGFHTVTPYFVVDDAEKFRQFLMSAFNAKEGCMMRMPNGTIMHGQCIIGDSYVMFGQAGGEHKAMPLMMYLYLPDCDAAHAAAIRAGGKSLQEPKDMFYGDRSGAVTDPCGNIWWLATHIEDISAEELERRGRAARG